MKWWFYGLGLLGCAGGVVGVLGHAHAPTGDGFAVVGLFVLYSLIVRRAAAARIAEIVRRQTIRGGIEYKLQHTIRVPSHIDPRKVEQLVQEIIDTAITEAGRRR